jgi:uncharacterized repeat protein (TIGR04138 family)
MSMSTHDQWRQILEICARDPRYRPQAYVFVFEALDYTIEKLGRRQKSGLERHITGQELLAGIREFARSQFGLLARVVFEYWGVRHTQDFGEIVFNLVEGELLSRRETDTKDDFTEGFDFRKTFEEEYEIEIPWDRIGR